MVDVETDGEIVKRVRGIDQTLVYDAPCDWNTRLVLFARLYTARTYTTGIAWAFPAFLEYECGVPALLTCITSVSMDRQQDAA